MVRSAASKVMWLAKGAALFWGAVLTLALIFGVASMAFGDNGEPFLLGRLTNTASALTKLTGNVDGSAMEVVNNNAGTDDTALSLNVQSGEAPLRVNSAKRVANLNADKVDGKDFEVLRAYELFFGTMFGPLPTTTNYESQGGTLIISASGSGFRGTGSSLKEGKIGMRVLVDGTLYGRLGVYTNERNSHKAFVSRDLVVYDLPAGWHTLRLEEDYETGICNTANETQRDYCTDTDGNDLFQATVTEIPD